VSANRYWISFYAPKLKRVCVGPSTEAKAYKKLVGHLALEAGVRQPLAGPIEVTLQLFPHLPKDWAKRAKADPVWWDLTVMSLDLDNAQKVVWDALKNIAFTDDRLIRKAHAEIAVPDGEARVVVTIRPYEREHPQEGLFASEPVYVPRKPDAKPRAKTPKHEAPALAELAPGQMPF
jgi:crossover junction endodeoxyribonuclease RusA